MILVYLKNGECIEHEGAVEGQVQGSHLVLTSADGAEVARYESHDVILFSGNGRHIQAMKSEVCDEDGTSDPDSDATGTPASA